MKNFKKNMLGFAHHAVLGVVVVALIAYVGVRVINGSHALEVTDGGGGYTNGKIYSGYFEINPDGSGFQALYTPSGFAAGYSNMSFDGTQVAYFTTSGKDTTLPAIYKGTITNSSNTGSKASLSLSNISALASIPSGTYEIMPPIWSPDGTKVAAAIMSGATKTT
ncbi:MAG TPA: hypothetical protein VFK97_03325, partial [Candidatus Saccharimonadales bacterium]|nr:hypothetical protein [Candidatus Saccharimonadales bacterium]